MKNKKIAWAMLPALLAMLLAACGSPKSTETGTDTGTDTETGTETETETGGTQTETSEVITHRPGYVKGSPEGAVTRKFDEEFDTLLDDSVVRQLMDKPLEHYMMVISPLLLIVKIKTSQPQITKATNPSIRWVLQHLNQLLLSLSK